MLQITPHQTILLGIKPVDFRRGIDGLAGLCQTQLGQDPFSGKLFVFTNRRKTSVKIIVYDGQGYFLCQKRFSQGKLAWWPSADQSPSYELLASQLQILLYQGIPEGAKIPADWRRIKPPATIAVSPQAVADSSKVTKEAGCGA